MNGRHHGRPAATRKSTDRLKFKAEARVQERRPLPREETDSDEGYAAQRQC
jgi:hypothetical protein